jgi:ABC-type glutathione transport system ATPase component
LPHEFSGGMRQRIVIAGAVITGPDLLLADEPTTALDPTIQAQVLDLLEELRRSTGSTLLLISHDLDVVAERCDRVLVLAGGRLVESGTAAAVATSPVSDAGKRLAAARRRRGAPQPMSGGVAPLLRVEDLRVEYRGRRRAERAALVRAVAGVSFTVGAAESVGLVGESGCGKTSVAHALLRVVPCTGAAKLAGIDLLASEGEALRRLRRRIQLVPQDAGASLTPHLRVGTYRN